jgi:GT2 family glycosyltransferase
MSKKAAIRYSIIVPVKEINEYIEEHIARFKSLARRDVELIILPNSQTKLPGFKNVSFHSTGRVSPAIKRDVGAEISRGEFLVFLDDDAFFDDSYFSILDSFYKDHPQSAIGGPGITPKDNSPRQKASGAVYEDGLLSSDSHRYLSKGSLRNVDDWPSVNFSIPRIVFIEVGGFDQHYWPGEDTMFCRKIISLGIAIYYEPSLIAYHHRRESIIDHIKQASGYGYHRGYFAKKFPENSRKIKYFIPSLFALYISSLLLSTMFSLLVPKAFPAALVIIYLSPLIIYVVALGLAFCRIAKTHSPYVAFLALFYFPFTHLAYGFRFFLGFLSRKELRSALR